jgi:hypothetical protein
MIALALLLKGSAEGVSSYRIFGDEAYPQQNSNLYGVNHPIKHKVSTPQVKKMSVTPGFKEQSPVHLIHAPRRQHI